jgi:hypothetical protein
MFHKLIVAITYNIASALAEMLYNKIKEDGIVGLPEKEKPPVVDLIEDTTNGERSTEASKTKG